MPDYKLISADSHVNEVEATWTLAQKKHADRAPHIIWNPSERELGPYLVIDGWTSSVGIVANRESCANEYIGFVIGGLDTGGTGAGTTPRTEASQLGRVSSKAVEFQRKFRFEDYPGPGLDPRARLRDQDKDRVEVEILYASHLRHCYDMSAKDEPFFHDLAESYNEWLMDFCSENPKRLIGLPVISVLNPGVAAKDIRNYAKRGAKGFMMGSSVPIGMSYSEPMFDPIWAAAEECGTPLSMHATTGRFKQPNYNSPRGRSIVGKQVEVQVSIAEMIYGGVFDRFPNLKIVSSEFDIGWVGYMVQRIDSFDPRLGLKLSPADYIRRNVWFTFQNDRVGVLTAASSFGQDNFLWASDFPHGVTTWPDSHAIVDLQMQGVAAETMRKIVRQNVIDLYNLDL